MKKKIILILLALFLLLPNIHVEAESPYTTWARGPGGHMYMTQDAYRPSAEIDLPISAAEDLVITEDGTIFIADTGNGRIVKVKDQEIEASYGEDFLKSPTGLFIDPEGTMYVADAGDNQIFIIDKDGNLLNQFGRPSEPLFGADNQFLPRKVAVDARKNIYIISEGSTDGVVQMNTNGNFIGYFGANTSSMSLKMILQRMFLTKEQLAQFIKNEAASPSNIAIDKQGLVYTITAGTTWNKVIRKFTVSGRNIFPDANGSTTFRDIDISGSDLVLAVDAEGTIFEYNANGTILFVFGALDTGKQRLGTLRNPTGIGRYGETIYVLDKDKNAIITYQTTAFAQQVHEGVRLYMEGYYAEAKPYFESVLNFNGSYIMAYQAIADAYYKQRDFDSALQYYKYAEDQKGYSEAYWELRNVQLQKYLTSAIIVLVALSIVNGVVKRLDKRYKWFDPARNWFKGLTRFKLVDDLVFMFRFIKQPADSFYYIKKNLRGSIRFAVIIYVLVVVLRVAILYVTGFIFNSYVSLSDIKPLNEIIYTVLAIFIWNAANYLISTISDGEGRIKDVVIGTAYSLFPYVLFALPIALLTRVLSLNEAFIYSLGQNLIYVWVGLMLFIMVKEIHNYSFGETLKNVLLTIFTMGLFLLTGYILYVLFNQLFDFISAIFQEVRLRG